MPLALRPLHTLVVAKVTGLALRVASDPVPRTATIPLSSDIRAWHGTPVINPMPAQTRTPA